MQDLEGCGECCTIVDGGSRTPPEIEEIIVLHVKVEGTLHCAEFGRVLRYKSCGKKDPLHQGSGWTDE